jgi:hypothetical protein
MCVHYMVWEQSWANQNPTVKDRDRIGVNTWPKSRMDARLSDNQSSDGFATIEVTAEDRSRWHIDSPLYCSAATDLVSLDFRTDAR